jgi:hypothetical protein
LYTDLARKNMAYIGGIRNRPFAISSTSIILIYLLFLKSLSVATWQLTPLGRRDVRFFFFHCSKQGVTTSNSRYGLLHRISGKFVNISGVWNTIRVVYD